MSTAIQSEVGNTAAPITRRAFKSSLVTGPSAPAVERLAFSMREAAIAIGVSYITMHRLIARGLIKSNGALRTKIISRAELERFVNS